MLKNGTACGLGRCLHREPWHSWLRIVTLSLGSRIPNLRRDMLPIGDCDLGLFQWCLHQISLGVVNWCISVSEWLFITSAAVVEPQSSCANLIMQSARSSGAAAMTFAITYRQDSASTPAPAARDASCQNEPCHQKFATMKSDLLSP